MKTFSKTDIGMVREVNQDYVFVTETPIGNLPNLLVVADGMGGHRAGEYASRLAVEVLKQELEGSTGDSPEAVMRNAITRANERVLEAARQDAKLSGMGTTLVVATVIERTLYFANVGDSRAYLIAENGLCCITTDHNVASLLYEQGKITESEMAVHPQKHMLTRAVGVEKTVLTDTFILTYEDKISLLLCSDGLSGYCSDDEIYDVLSETDFDSAAESLIQLALNKGGRDNVTVAVISS